MSIAHPRIIVFGSPEHPSKTLTLYDEADHTMREVTETLKGETCTSISTSLLITVVFILFVTVVTAPPTQSPAKTAGILLGIVASWIGLIFIAKLLNGIAKLACWKSEIVQFGRHLLTIAWIVGYIYIALYSPVNTCVSLSSVASSVRSITCPWTDGSAIASSAAQPQCVAANFDLEISGLCTGTQIINRGRLCTTATTSAALANTNNNTIDYNANATLLEQQQQPNNTCVWVPDNDPNGRVAVQVVDSTRIEVVWQNSSVPMQLSLSESIVCGASTKSFCVFPVALPPFLGTAGGGSKGLVFRPTTAANILSFLSNFLGYAIVLILYICIVIVRLTQKRCRRKRSPKDAAIQQQQQDQGTDHSSDGTHIHLDRHDQSQTITIPMSFVNHHAIQTSKFSTTIVSDPANNNNNSNGVIVS